MAYNNGFPMAYQPYYPMQNNAYPTQISQIQQPAQSAQQVGNIIWVSGEAGAKAYLVAPNTTVQLWDSEADVIYIKSADASGMPNIKILDYKIRDNSQPQAAPHVVNPTPDYVTREEFNSFVDKFNHFAEASKKVNGNNNNNNKGGKTNE